MGSQTATRARGDPVRAGTAAARRSALSSLLFPPPPPPPRGSPPSDSSGAPPTQPAAAFPAELTRPPPLQASPSPSSGQVPCGVQVSISIKESMSTDSSTRRALRRQSQDVTAGKVVVNLETSSPVVGSHRAASAPVAGDRNLPIDVEAIEDEVQAVSPSRVPPQRRNRRTRRGPVTVVDLEVEGSREG